MSKVPLRSFAVLLVLLIAGCTSQPSVNPIAPEASGCGSGGTGVQHHDTPVVCVDGSAAALKVNPESIRVWNVGSADRRTPPNIQWITRGGGGNLQITMKDSGCVETPTCSGKGRCGAKVIGGLGAGAAEGTEIKRCRYTVTLDGRVLDPEAVIVSCCADASPSP
jgi:hypothetical protein